MQELAEIVTGLESGQASLDESLASFERGMALLRLCHNKLDAAAQRIEIVTRVSASGEPELGQFDATATVNRESAANSVRRSRGTSPPQAGRDDDGTLFD